MHEHLTVQDWIRLWGDPDLPGKQLAACPRCTPHRGDTEAWLRAIRECADCRAVLEATPLDRAEVLHCEQCMWAFGKLHELLEELEHFDPAVAAETAVADDLFGKLAHLSLPDQLARVTDDIRYQQWGLAQRLLHASREDWCNDPERARVRAAVAVAVADRLDPETYQPEWVRDLRAKAHAYLANTERILADFADAEREFLLAEFHLLRGVGGGWTRAEVFSLKASLLIDQGRFVEAGALLAAVKLFYEAEDRQALAKTYLKLAMVAAGQGEFQARARGSARTGSLAMAVLCTARRRRGPKRLPRTAPEPPGARRHSSLHPALGSGLECTSRWALGDSRSTVARWVDESNSLSLSLGGFLPRWQ